jgi:hypothetical protein
MRKRLAVVRPGSAGPPRVRDDLRRCRSNQSYADPQTPGEVGSDLDGTAVRDCDHRDSRGVISRCDFEGVCAC